MAEMKPAPWLEHLMSAVFFLSGLAIILVSTNVIPVEDESFNAPRWVVGGIGGVFSMAGLMIFSKGNWKWMNNFFMFFLLTSFGCGFTWIAFFGDAEGFSMNGVSGLNSIGVFVARSMFGFFGGMCLLLVIGTLIHQVIKFYKWLTTK